MILHPRGEVDRLYESRKEDGIEQTSIQWNVNVSRQRQEDYIKHAE